MKNLIYHNDYQNGKNNFTDNDQIYGLGKLQNRTAEYKKILDQNYIRQKEFYDKLLSKLKICNQ